MSNAAINNPLEGEPPLPEPPESQPQQEAVLWKGKARSWVRQLIGETLSRWGARLGAIWIGLLAFVGIFAPLIASSHPYIMKVDGEVSYPLLRFLTPTDITLLVLTFTGVVLYFIKRLSSGKRVMIFLAVMVVTIPLSMFKKTPLIPNHRQYRDLEQAAALGGADAPKIDYIIRAPLPYSPEDYLRDRPETRLKPPGGGHLLGTEINGADILSRMMHASRTALAIGFVSTGIAVVIGVTLGGLMGYFAKAVDMLGMRLVEIFEAIPSLFLILTFVAFFGHNIIMIMVILGVTSWTGYARFIRAEFLKLRQQDFVVAAQACGLRSFSRPHSASWALARSASRVGVRCWNRRAAPAENSTGGSPCSRALRSS